MNPDSSSVQASTEIMTRSKSHASHACLAATTFLKCVVFIPLCLQLSTLASASTIAMGRRSRETNSTDSLTLQVSRRNPGTELTMLQKPPNTEDNQKQQTDILSTTAHSASKASPAPSEEAVTIQIGELSFSIANKKHEQKEDTAQLNKIAQIRTAEQRGGVLIKPSQKKSYFMESSPPSPIQAETKDSAKTHPITPESKKRNPVKAKDIMKVLANKTNKRQKETRLDSVRNIGDNGLHSALSPGTEASSMRKQFKDLFKRTRKYLFPSLSTRRNNRNITLDSTRNTTGAVNQTEIYYNSEPMETGNGYRSTAGDRTAQNRNDIQATYDTHWDDGTSTHKRTNTGRNNVTSNRESYNSQRADGARTYDIADNERSNRNNTYRSYAQPWEHGHTTYGNSYPDDRRFPYREDGASNREDGYFYDDHNRRDRERPDTFFDDTKNRNGGRDYGVHNPPDRGFGQTEYEDESEKNINWEGLYYTKYADVVTEIRAQLNIEATSNHSCRHVRGVPDSIRQQLNLDNFYQKYTEAYGIPVLSSSAVPDAALRRACYITRFMFADHADIRSSYRRRHGRVAVIGRHERTTQIPEHRYLGRKWDRRARGFGANERAPVCTVGEENLLRYGFPSDRWYSEDIGVHEIAHGLHLLGAKYVWPKWSRRLQERFVEARRRGLWQNTYAATNYIEYFAEGVQKYFGVDAYSPVPNGNYNHVNTRAKLLKYDAPLHDLIAEMFPCNNEYLTRETENFLSAGASQTLNLTYPACRAMEAHNETASTAWPEDATFVSTTPRPATTPRPRPAVLAASPNIITDILSAPSTRSTRSPRSADPVTKRPEPAPPKDDQKATSESCRDGHKHCAYWAKSGYCYTNADYMTKSCRKSCRLCGQCADQNQKCAQWADKGECKRNPGYMLYNCRASCGECSSRAAIPK